MSGSSFRHVCTEPFAQRCCCDLKRVHLDRHFGRSDDVRDEDEPPAAQLRAIAQIEILGQRVVLPAARVVDGRPAPDAGGAVEIEEAPAPVAAAMFEHEVTVEEDRLYLREQRVVLVDVPPACLHHADFGIGKMGHQPRQEVGASE